MSGGVTAAVLASERVFLLSWGNLILPLAILGLGILTLYSKRISKWLEGRLNGKKKSDKNDT